MQNGISDGEGKDCYFKTVIQIIRNNFQEAGMQRHIR
jgi:hypothetical protein